MLAMQKHNTIAYLQKQGDAFDPEALSEALDGLWVVVHGGRDRKTLIEQGVKESEDILDSLNLYRFTFHCDGGGKQPSWQPAFSWSNMVIVQIILRRQYLHGELDSKDQLEVLQWLAPVFCEMCGQRAAAPSGCEWDLFRRTVT